jgi:RES domain-containing protein
MIVYRIARIEHADLHGEGARLYPGRWNAPGIPGLYTASSPSLAQLEVMVNAEDWTIFSRLKFMLLSIAVTHKYLIEFLSDELPKNWNAPVVTEETQEFGKQQLDQLNHIGFIVPSVVTPQEKNIILNPRAERFNEHVKLISTEEFRIDDRLISG